MQDSPVRIAYFARGMDGLFLRPPHGFEMVALVRGDSLQSEWLKAWLPAERIINFRLKQHRLDPYPSTEELLRGSNITACLKKQRISHLMLSSSCTEWMDQWACEHQFQLIATDFALQQKLEHKIWFDRFLTRQQLPRPDSQVVTIGKTRRIKFTDRVVLQRADSLGGEGTFILDDVGGIEDCLTRGSVSAGERCLVRRFIDGRPFGITVFVSPDRIELSALRLQCYYPSSPVSGRKFFAGVQWVPDAELSSRLRQRVRRCMMALGRSLHAQRFYGFANVDFMVDDADRVFIIECNPRMSAATPQLLQQTELSYGADFGGAFISGFFEQRPYAKPQIRLPKTESKFCGATLDLMPANTGRDFEVRQVNREFPSGVYVLRPRGIRYVTPDVTKMKRPDEFCLVSFAERGQQCQEETTLGSIVTQFQLFDESGMMLPACHRLIDHFQYV